MGSDLLRRGVGSVVCAARLRRYSMRTVSFAVLAAAVAVVTLSAPTEITEVKSKVEKYGTTLAQAMQSSPCTPYVHPGLCVRNDGCGYCNGKCVEGNATMPLYEEGCTPGSYIGEILEDQPCAYYNDCALCSERMACGWCMLSAQCIQATFDGRPMSSVAECPMEMFTVHECPEGSESQMPRNPNDI